mgnify:CR=1 FL=1
MTFIFQSNGVRGNVQGIIVVIEADKMIFKLLFCYNDLGKVEELIWVMIISSG